MKGNSLGALIGIGVAGVILAIMAPLMYSAFVAPVSQTFDVTENLNLSNGGTGLNGTTYSLPDGGYEYLKGVKVSNSTTTLPATDYTLDTNAKTIAFKIAGVGKLLPTNTTCMYDVTGTWGASGYQDNAVNRTLAPFALTMLFVAMIAMVAFMYF